MAATVVNDIEITGRKIFFVNPSYIIKSKIITVLQDKNYEVYSIENYKNLRALLKFNPNSIVFLDIDNQLSLCGWIALVQTFLKYDGLKTCLYGFISTKIKQNEAAAIFDVIDLKAGITLIENDIQKTIQQLNGILEASNAKGQRQYVRASCIGKNNVNIFLTTYSDEHGTLMHQMKIIDISNASVAVLMPDTLKGRLKSGNLIKQATVVLDGRQVVSDLVILTIRNTQKEELVIMTYKGFMSDQEKLIIKEFVFDTLKKKMMASINGCVLDKEDYNQIGSIEPDIINFINIVKNQKASKSDETKGREKKKNSKNETVTSVEMESPEEPEEIEAKKEGEAYLQKEGIDTAENKPDEKHSQNEEKISEKEITDSPSLPEIN